MKARDRLMAMFRGDGTQTHYELISSQGGRHAVPAMDAADLILDVVLPDYEAAVDALERMVAFDEDPGEFEALNEARAVLRRLRPEVSRV